MTGGERVEYDPPRRVQVRTHLGRWADAVQHAWQYDRLRRTWTAIVTVQVDANGIRPWRGGAAAHRSDEYPRRKSRQPPPPPYT